MYYHLLRIALLFYIGDIYVLKSTAEESLECSSPRQINSQILSNATDGATYPIGTTIRYQCDYGYLYDGGEDIVRCELRPGAKLPTWSRTNFKCKPQSCSDPGHIPNGRREGHLFTFSSRVRYACNEGYVLHGVQSRYCQPSGEWTGSLPQCKPVQCPRPLVPENGTVNYKSTEFKSVAKFECNPGYELIGSQTSTCQGDKTWSPATPTCEEQICPMLEAPSNGHIKLLDNSTRSGSTALFICDPGTTIHGSPVSKCLPSKTWNFPVPQCLKKCTVPKIKNGKLGINKPPRWSGSRTIFEELDPGSDLKTGDTATVQCSLGYALSRGAQRQQSVTCDDGILVGLSECVPAACKNPPSVRNGMPEKRAIQHGEKVVYRCNPGYELSPPNPDYWCEYGEFRGEKPRCQWKPAKCSIPYMANGKYLIWETFWLGISGDYVKADPGTIVNHERKVWIVCNSGYAVEGETGRSRAEGDCWNGSLRLPHSCLPERKTCKNPPRIQNGWPQNNLVPDGEVVEYNCTDFYTIVYPEKGSELICYQGRFVGIRPFCKPSYCSLATSTVPYGFVNQYLFKDGEKVQYRCQSGYILVDHTEGKNPLRCIKGELVGESPVCKRHEDCIVEWIYGGNLRVVEEHAHQGGVLKILSPGNVIPDKESAYLFCGGQHLQTLRCQRGNWNVRPHCAFPGLNPSPSQPTTPSLSTESIRRVTSPHPTYILPIPVSMPELLLKSTVQPIKPEEPDHGITDITVPVQNGQNNPIIPSSTPQSHCILPQLSSDVVAFSNFSQVFSLSEIPSGSEVFFHCKTIGTQYRKGVEKLMCQNGAWKPSNSFPECIKANGTAPVILLAKNSDPITMGQEGALILKHPINLNLLCAAANGRTQVRWGIGKHRPEIQTKNYDASVPSKNIIAAGLIITSNAPLEATEMIKCISEASQEEKSLTLNYMGGTIAPSLELITTPEPPSPTFPNTTTESQNFSTNSSVHLSESVNSAISVSEESAVTELSFTGEDPSERRTVDGPPENDASLLDAASDKVSTTTQAALPEVTTFTTTNTSSCVFNFDENVQGFLENFPLPRGHHIQDGGQVKLHCSNFGEERFHGARTILCTNGKWTVPEKRKFPPKCSLPKSADAPLISFDVPKKEFQVGPGGVLMLLRSTSLVLSCTTRSKWSRTMQLLHQKNGNSSNRKQLLSEGMAVQGLNATITNLQENDSGDYVCKINDREHRITISVIDGCNVADFYNVTHEQNAVPVLQDGQRFFKVGKKLMLTCENHHQLTGSDTLTCQPDGTWTPADVKCVPGCPPPKPDDPYIIVTGLNPKGYQSGDELVFSCPAGYHPSTTHIRSICLEGKWHPEEIPKCFLEGNR